MLCPLSIYKKEGIDMERVIAVIAAILITALYFVIMTDAIPIYVRRYKQKTLKWYHTVFIILYTISYLRGIVIML